MTDTAVQQGTATVVSVPSDQFPVGAKVEAKDLVVFITFLSSALSLVYDSGFFWGLDLAYFTFFTLAEHLLFALEGIPITLMVVALVLLAHAKVTASRLLDKQRVAQRLVYAAPMSDRRRNLLMVFIFLGFFGLAYAAFLTKEYTAMLLFGLAPIIFYLTIESLTFHERAVWVPSIAFCLVLVTFVYGFEIGRAYANTSWVTHTILTKADSMCSTVRIVRSGAAGVLLIDQPSTQIGFVRWDDIKKITAFKKGEPTKCPTPTTPLALD
jgi:hypothetical protein